MRKIAVFVGLSLGSGLGIAACVGEDVSADTQPDASNTSSSSSSGGEGTSSSGGSSCAEGLTQCGAECKDLQSDVQHCGACGRACGAGEGCFAGACESRAIKAFSVHGSMTCAVQFNGVLSCWGRSQNNSFGRTLAGSNECGVGCTMQPVPIDLGDEKAVQVSVGTAAACAVTESGAVYCWGRNEQGELGQEIAGNCDGKTCVSSPKKVEGLPAVAEVSVGSNATCARSVASEVYCWGKTSDGVVPQGGANPWEPRKVEALPPVRALSLPADGGHACAIAKESDALWCWGNNRNGATGQPIVPAPSIQPVPMMIGGARQRVAEVVTLASSTCIRTQESRVYCWGYAGYGVPTDATTGGERTPSSPDPIEQPELQGATSLAGSSGTLCAIVNGKVKCRGQSEGAVLGFVDSSNVSCFAGAPFRCKHQVSEVRRLERVKQIKVGWSHGFALLDDGTLHGWGKNVYGEVGVRNADETVCKTLANVDEACFDLPQKYPYLPQ